MKEFPFEVQGGHDFSGSRTHSQPLTKVWFQFGCPTLQAREKLGIGTKRPRLVLKPLRLQGFEQSETDADVISKHPPPRGWGGDEIPKLGK